MKDAGRPLRLLALTRYSSGGASSRVRLLQYLPALQAAEIETTVEPFFGDEYIEALYGGRVAYGSILRAYGHRIASMRRTREYDFIWLEKEALPWMPFRVEGVLAGSMPTVIVDYDDAVFHRYDAHDSSMVRRLLGGKIDAVMSHADTVIAGNEYIADRARVAGARRVEWLPTVVDLERYSEKPSGESDEKTVTIGWIGSPATAHFLEFVAPALRSLAETRRIRCVAIGARPDQLEGTPFESWAWTEDSEAELLRGFDIGIMPLTDTPFERGKCGYKLIQYMACGLPVVASPVGVNSEIVSPDVGLLASDDRGWFEALQSLVDDAALRRRLGHAGRRKVETAYSLQVQAPRFIDMLRSVANRAH